jgi:hypothetical protein
LHSLRFIPLRDAAPYWLAKSLNTLKLALVDGSIEHFGKEEHLLSWSFLGQTPEAARIGDLQVGYLASHIQQVFVTRDEDIGLGS